MVGTLYWTLLAHPESLRGLERMGLAARGRGRPFARALTGLGVSGRRSADDRPPESDAEIAINSLVDKRLRRNPVGMGEEGR